MNKNKIIHEFLQEEIYKLLKEIDSLSVSDEMSRSTYYRRKANLLIKKEYLEELLKQY